MGTHLPPPSAAQVWTLGSTLFLRFPGAQGHTVEIPLDKMVPDTGLTGLPVPAQRGFAVLIATLRAREYAKAHERAIGYAGTPPKHEIETALANDEKYKAWFDSIKADKAQTAAEKAEALALLGSLGL